MSMVFGARQPQAKCAGPVEFASIAAAASALALSSRADRPPPAARRIDPSTAVRGFIFEKYLQLEALGKRWPGVAVYLSYHLPN